MKCLSVQYWGWICTMAQVVLYSGWSSMTKINDQKVIENLIHDIVYVVHWTCRLLVYCAY